MHRSSPERHESRTESQDLFDAARRYVHATYGPVVQAVTVTITLSTGGRVVLPIVPGLPPGAPDPGGDGDEPFVPSPFQEAILAALEGQARRTDALAREVGDRSRLFRHPGGLKELRDRGLVKHHPRLGFYREDALPDQLAGHK
jgi:hypothetical protein